MFPPFNFMNDQYTHIDNTCSMYQVEGSTILTATVLSFQCLTHFLCLGLFVQHALGDFAHGQGLDRPDQIPLLDIRLILNFLQQIRTLS